MDFQIKSLISASTQRPHGPKTTTTVKPQWFLVMWEKNNDIIDFNIMDKNK